jgi:YHS domain-containing protein
MQKLLTLFLTLFAFLSEAQEYPEAVYTVKGLAIEGYDPVAYFTHNQPVKGSTDFTFQWKGATWLFSSIENRDTFKKSPEKYAPQYGGYCAWGMSEGYKAKVDPMNAWTLVDGKLYLNYNKSIKEKWLPEKEGRIKKADERWKEFSKN